MGLTIHYGLKYTGKEPDAILSRLRDYALQYPFKEIGDIVHFKGDECDFNKCDKESEHRWLLIQSQVHLHKLNYYLMVNPIEIYAFSTWPGDGCEQANFGLCRYPASFDAKELGKLRTGKGTGWHWHSFCKTQYANQYGLENFIKCHTLVIAMLDSAKHLGILKEVHDESDYYDNRNPESLGVTIQKWDNLVASIGGKLKELIAGTKGELTIESPILNGPF